MHSLFNPDSFIMRFLSRVADLIILNLLTLICCLPVFTIGTAITSLYAAMDKLKKEEGTLLKNYFSAFKMNFVQSTVQWVILFILGTALFFAYFFYEGAAISIAGVLQYLSVLLLILWLFCISWVFPLQAKFHVTVRGNLKNAMICAFAFLPRTLGLAFVNAFPVIVLFFSPLLFMQVSFLWVFLWFSLAVWINLSLLKKPFEVISDDNPKES